VKLLDGKVCVITGAASEVGRAAAVRFAEHGAFVVVGDVRDAWAQATVRLVEEAGASAIAAHCDVSQEGDVESLIAVGVEHFGRLDVMHNNADVALGLRIAERMRSGSVQINTGLAAGYTPMGGYRQSGYGRERGAAGIRPFQERKHVVVGSR